MLSQIGYVNHSKIIKDWQLGDYLGIPFEKHLYNVLSRHMEKQYAGRARVYATSASRDDGKDIIIESEVDIYNLMGHTFYLRGNKQIKIYIECKSSTNNKISLNQLAGNSSRVGDDCIQYYVVVTNTTLAPYTFYQFDKALKDLNIEFVLVDQTLLIPYLIAQEAFIGNIKKDKFENLHNIYSEYQILRYEKNFQVYFDIYLVIRNYKAISEKIKLTLGSDHDWTLTPTEVTVLLGKNQFRCIKLIAKRNYYGGMDQFNIIFQLNEAKNIIEIKGVNVEFDFLPPLHGIQHYEVLDKLTDHIINSTTYQVKYLIGDSGCGKTRIIDELYKRILGRNVNMILIKCTRNEGKIKRDLKKALTSEKLLLQDIKEQESLPFIIKNINTQFQRCVLIFDDIHNLNSLLDELKEAALIELNKAITIILVGRNDFSAGTSDYFSFLQWCQEKNLIKGDVIQNLTEKDSKNLIRSIINDVPNFVLNSILSKSHGNPLFIIQFIEYLLETNLAHIINRTTVGILNIDTFTANNCIPEKIKDIYKERCKILKKEKHGSDILDFLLLSAFIGMTFKKDIALSYFNDSSESMDILIKRKFLKYSEDGELCFYHETLYIYLKNTLTSNPLKYYRVWKRLLSFRTFLSELDLGIVHFYNNDFEIAAKQFTTIFIDCEKLENYSAVNISPRYYEYLDIAYKIAKQKGNLKLQKKIILYKIYTALHYYTPMTAVDECINTIELLSDNHELADDSLFFYNINTLKAHAYMNAGQLKNSERYLTECLSLSLIYPDKVQPASKFDMFDRLAGLYIRYNHFLLADNYNKLSGQLAQEISDPKLMALSIITNAKLNLYMNADKATNLLKDAKKLLKDNHLMRNYYHNEISIIIQQLPTYMHDKNWINESQLYVNECQNISIENGFNSSVIRSYLVLSVLEFLKNGSENNFKNMERLISKGIDASIRYGISTYIWEFYNLKLIIASRLHQDEEYIMKITETIRRILQQQNLLYLGTLDFCYANILVLTNIGKYMSQETEFYQFMNSLTYCNTRFNSGCNFNCNDGKCLYVCDGAVNKYKQEFNHIRNKGLLLMSSKVTYPLMDSITGYYIALT